MSFPPPSPYQARVIWFALTGLAIAALALLGVALIWGLGQVLQLLSPVLWPLAVAGVLAYLLDPVVDFFQRKGVPRTRSILLVFGIALVLFLSVLSSVVPQLAVETGDLVQKIPGYTRTLQVKVEGWMRNPPGPVRKVLGMLPVTQPGTNAPVETNGVAHVTDAPPPDTGTNTVSLFSGGLGKDTWHAASAFLARAAPKVGHWVFGQVTKVASWFGVLAGLALIPVYAFYFLLEKRGIESKWTDYLPLSNSRFKDELVFVLRSINEYLIVFFRGQVLVAICDGVLYTIGFLAIGLPYAVLLGAMAIVLTIIPFLGAIATCGAALILAIVQYGDWKHPLLVLAVFGVVQFLEGFVIQPKILGDRVGLHPLTIIIAVMVGTTLLGGILGGILAIPLTAALRVVMFRYVWKKRGAAA
jgi:predicted PurR-regulated permease PerM